jgi:riboflavin biosynthesis pyrimidine reductase
LSADALELLAEPPGLRSFPLPEKLRELYPGSIGFPDEWVFANFVSTIDGVVALPGVTGSNRLIADSSEADRLVMGLLRACADIVLIGAGTLRGSPRAVWTADAAYPDAAAAFAELRSELGLQAQPAVAIVTSGAAFPAGHPILEREPLILTTRQAAVHLEPLLPRAEVIAVGEGEQVGLPEAIDALRARGYGRILSEGGPHLLGSLLAASLVDELFLTVSPLVAGRPSTAGAVLSLVEGVGLLPGRRVASELHGIRRHGDHLFLRYALAAG